MTIYKELIGKKPNPKLPENLAFTRCTLCKMLSLTVSKEAGKHRLCTVCATSPAIQYLTGESSGLQVPDWKFATPAFTLPSLPKSNPKASIVAIVFFMVLMGWLAWTIKDAPVRNVGPETLEVSMR